MNRLILVLSLFFFAVHVPANLSAQELLSRDDVLLSLEQNSYDLSLLQQNIASAEVLCSKYNRGYMPVVGINAGLGTDIGSQRLVYNAVFPDQNIKNAANVSGSVGVSAGYLIYDGGTRKVTNAKNLAELELAQLQFENTWQSLNFSASQLYYSIAQLKYNETLLEENWKISNERLERAQVYYENGQGSRVDVLNAEVDLARDSLQLIAARTDGENLKWQLNQFTLRQDIDYVVDSIFALEYQGRLLDELQTTLLDTNAELATLRKNKDIIAFDVDLAERINSPAINANAAYDLGYQKNDGQNLLNYSRSNGLSLGITANWNFLDGGQRKLQAQLVELRKKTVEIELASKENELLLLLNRLWNSYQNSLLSMELEQKSIEASTLNFQRVKELYNNGQQSAIEFRQAQLNLFNGQAQYYNALIAAKLYEVELDFLLNDK
ncbi:TolC family protein [Chitinophagales bacterium]|nr:TolC family protein [Chitinophagales bacterium]